MPDTYSFVDFVLSVSDSEATAQAAPTTGQPATHGPVLTRIEFKRGSAALIDAGTPQGRAWAQVLELVGKSGEPVYIEVDPVDRRLTRLLLPLVVKVASIQPASDGVEVELLISHARHHLRKSLPSYERQLAALKAAQANGAWVAVTETPMDHDIFDVTPVPKGREPPPTSAASEEGASIQAVVSLAQAQRLFNLMNSRVCCPAGAGVPCIPFGYPDDGCWGRAHEMVRLMGLEGVQADKVWIYGRLRVATRNHPRCEVQWGWHVAPTLQVDIGGGRSETYVIDPSLFPGPVPRATWAGVQGDSNAQLSPSAGSAFYRTAGGVITTDPTYSQTNAVLDRYRSSLRLRATGGDGPPPYPNCIPAQQGVQFVGSLAPGVTHKWFTFGWPAQWHVLWTVMPLTTCPGTPQLKWRTQVERASANQATYWLAVTNNSNATVRFEGRFDVLSR